MKKLNTTINKYHELNDSYIKTILYKRDTNTEVDIINGLNKISPLFIQTLKNIFEKLPNCDPNTSKV